MGAASCIKWRALSRPPKNFPEDRFRPLIYIRGSVCGCFRTVALPNQESHRAGTGVLPRPTRNRRRGVTQRGVTLIELLIAVSITAVIVVGLLFALRTSIAAYETTSDRLHTNREQLNRNQILARELGGAMPVLSLCGNALTPFFTGAPDSLRMISSYSIGEGFRGYPQILTFQVRRSPSGALQLAVTENPYTGPASTVPFCGSTGGGAYEVSSGGPGPFILADDLVACALSYRPVDNPLANQVSDWVPEWTNKNTLPAGIRVQMKPRAAPGGGLPLVNVTVPLRVDRDIFRGYPD
jgi:prepilin-type N-terminal cleavage/methylation domain-containing protein